MKAHPWLIGFGWGAFCGEVVAITFFLDGASEADAVTAGVFVGLVLWPFQALSIKRGWFERPDPSPPGTPGLRPLRTTSDLGLRWFILVGGVAVIGLAHSLLAGEGSAVVPAVLIGTMLPLTFLVWRELRRRKRTAG